MSKHPTATIKFMVTTTISLPTNASLHPQAGAVAVGEHLEAHARTAGLALEHTRVHLMTISRPNPNAEQDLAPTAYTVLDRDGQPMPQRDFQITDGKGQLPFLLMLREGSDDQRWRIHSAHAAMPQAVQTAQDWQEGRTAVNLGELPLHEAGRDQRPGTGLHH